MRVLRLVVLAGMAQSLASCSGSGSTNLVTDTEAPDVVEVSMDVGSETLPVPDTAAEVAPDLAADLWAEVLPEVIGPACNPGEGCFLDGCTDNAQCDSGLCVEHMGDGVCTQTCTEECPPGWSCKQIGAGGPDVVWACVSKHANLCKPCAASDGCKSPGGMEDACLDYGAEGSFCGGACASDDDCPWGFACTKASTVDRVELTQCVSVTGSCPCTDKSVALGLTTPCSASNDFGECTGQRVCEEGGLSACSAAVPAEETCNGVDDDCDGDTDEPDQVGGDFINLCDDGNECTDDLCNGADGCQHVALTSDECKDGNPCTAADHCVAGVCVGTPVECDDFNPCTDDTCNDLGGCIFTPNDADCDDKDPCTVADRCEDSACLGVAVACDCASDADCAALEDGNLCNGTLVCDTSKVPFLCKLDPATVVTCPGASGADAACLDVTCDPAAGTCATVPANDGKPCSDADACTVGDSCEAGKCAAGAPANCNDGNPCTDDGCAPVAGCFHSPNGAGCQDGSLCTAGDQCTAGECVPGALVSCDDGNPCTNDSCDPDLGCMHQAGGGPCDDGNACTGGDHCVAGACVFAGPVTCDDSEICTTDSCDPAVGCVYQLNDLPCDDGNICTYGDHCHLGACQPAGTMGCVDANPCTDDACKPGVGCVFTPNAAACDDGNACTTKDVCAAGKCLGATPPDCNDGDVCTDDSCDPKLGCVHKNNTAPCSDGDACTMGEACAAGTCTGGKPLSCNDGNACTADSCDPKSGCTFAPNAAACNDSDPCTTGDVCQLGACSGTGTLSCDDKDVCTDDTCVAKVGCTHTHNTAPCDDGDVCTVSDACKSGSCKGGVPLACDDSNACTVDSCVKGSGCAYAPAVDGTDCGNGKTCAGGVCVDCVHGSKAFSYTGNMQTFSVPQCATSVTLEAWGAQGGWYEQQQYGGKGGYAKGRSTGLAGKTLYLFVGGQGGYSGSTAVAGWNGGGGHTGGNSYTVGGGGASDVRVDGQTLSNRILVAGGGGGSAWCYNSSAVGGQGGGLEGTPGGHSGNSPDGYGRPGTQTAGGQGGNFSGPAPGGFLGQGGAANNTNSGCGGAGGGGGGYYGGGGGAHGGGGGGGSSYLQGLLDTNTQMGVRDGNGQVVITW